MMPDEDLRDTYIKSVLNDVGTVLSGKDLMLLENTMYAKFEGFTLARTCKELVVDDGNNADIIKRFFIAKKIEGLSERSLQVYFYHLRSTLEKIPKRIQDINVTDIRLSLAETMTNSSKIHADNQRRILSSFFTWCEEEDIIDRSPMRRIKKIKFPEHIRRPLEAIEVEKIRQAIGENIKERAIFEFLLSTACRAAEAVALNRRDVDLLSGEAIVMGKGSRERKVYLNAVAKMFLAQYLESRKDDNEALFVSDKKPYKRLGTGGVEDIIRKAGELLGMHTFPHRLRHTAATMALQRGMPIEQVQKMLGHKRIETTLIYAKTIADDVKYAHKKYC